MAVILPSVQKIKNDKRGRTPFYPVFSIRCKAKLPILMKVLEMGMLLSTVLRGVHYMMCLALGLRWSDGTKLRR